MKTKLIAFLFAAVVASLVVAATNAPPPLPTKTIGQPYSVDSMGNTNAVPEYPFLLATGVDTNGNIVLESPPQWMLDGPPPEPTKTTIRLKFYDKLNTNALYTVDFTCPRNSAFAGWGIIEE